MAVVHGADRPQVIHIPNGDPVTPMFSAQEMQRRLSGLRAVMAEVGVDAALFTSYHNINYYSDFLYCSFGRKYGLVVTADELDVDRREHRRRPALPPHVRRQHRLHRLAARQLLPRRAPADRRRAQRIGIEFDHVTLDAAAKLEGGAPRRRVRRYQPAVDARCAWSSRPRRSQLIRNGAADLPTSAAPPAWRRSKDGVPEHEVALALDAGDGARDRQDAIRTPS